MAKTYGKWSEQYFGAGQHTEQEKEGLLGMAATATEGQQIAEVVMEAVWIGEGNEEDIVLANEVLEKLGIEKLILIELHIEQAHFQKVVVPALIRMANVDGMSFGQLEKVIVAICDIRECCEEVEAERQKLLEKAAGLAKTFEDWETINIYAAAGSQLERKSKEKMQELM